MKIEIEIYQDRYYKDRWQVYVPVKYRTLRDNTLIFKTLKFSTKAYRKYPGIWMIARAMVYSSNPVSFSSGRPNEEYLYVTSRWLNREILIRLLHLMVIERGHIIPLPAEYTNLNDPIYERLMNSITL